jgi:hypothetical protein
VLDEPAPSVFGALAADLSALSDPLSDLSDADVDVEDFSASSAFLRDSEG